MDTLLAAVNPWLQAFLTALLPVLGTLALGWMRKRHLNGVMVEAIARAGGEAYRHLVASGRPVTDAAAVGRAIQAGGLYLADRVPDTLHAVGVTPEGAAQIVGAELGKLLAADPSVKVAG